MEAKSRIQLWGSAAVLASAIPAAVAHMAAATGGGPLTDAELRHFGAHGWVLRPGLFSASECAALRAAADAELEAKAAAQGTDVEALLVRQADGAVDAGRVVMHGIIDTVPHDEGPEGAASAVAADVFRTVWQDHSVIQPALKQLLGSTEPPAFTDSSLHVTPPHPNRHDPAVRSQLRQPSEMVWHRGIRPSWGVRPGLEEGQVCSSWVNTATFLTDVSDGDDGGTFLLSGSHIVDGDRQSDRALHCLHAPLDHRPPTVRR